jgi:hypothetical protein
MKRLLTTNSRVRDCVSFAAAIVVMLAGCGRGTDEVSRRRAQVAYDEAVAAVDNKDFTTAQQRLTEAIDSGLHVDLCDDAFGLRAVCHAALGNLQAAEADIAQMDEGGGDQSLILATKAYVLQKQGKAAEAKNSLQKAKQLNPKVRPFL